MVKSFEEFEEFVKEKTDREYFKKKYGISKTEAVIAGIGLGGIAFALAEAFGGNK